MRLYKSIDRSPIEWNHKPTRYKNDKLITSFRIVTLLKVVEIIEGPCQNDRLPGCQLQLRIPPSPTPFIHNNNPLLGLLFSYVLSAIFANIPTNVENITIQKVWNTLLIHLYIYVHRYMDISKVCVHCPNTFFLKMCIFYWKVFNFVLSLLHNVQSINSHLHLRYNMFLRQQSSFKLFPLYFHYSVYINK